MLSVDEMIREIGMSNLTNRGKSANQVVTVHQRILGHVRPLPGVGENPGQTSRSLIMTRVFLGRIWKCTFFREISVIM